MKVYKVSVYFEADLPIESISGQNGITISDLGLKIMAVSLKAAIDNAYVFLANSYPHLTVSFICSLTLNQSQV